MTNLIIGLCVGFAACVVLAIMWKAASDLRKQFSAEDEQGQGSSSEING